MLLDIVDITQSRIEKEESETLRKAKLPAGISSYVCDDCSGTLPESRRKAFPGVRTCIACQEERERKLP